MAYLCSWKCCADVNEWLRMTGTTNMDVVGDRRHCSGMSYHLYLVHLCKMTLVLILYEYDYKFLCSIRVRVTCL